MNNHWRTISGDHKITQTIIEIFSVFEFKIIMKLKPTSAKIPLIGPCVKTNSAAFSSSLAISSSSTTDDESNCRINNRRWWCRCRRRRCLRRSRLPLLVLNVVHGLFWHRSSQVILTPSSVLSSGNKGIFWRYLSIALPFLYLCEIVKFLWLNFPSADFLVKTISGDLFPVVGRNFSQAKVNKNVIRKNGRLIS